MCFENVRALSLKICIVFVHPQKMNMLYFAILSSFPAIVSGSSSLEFRLNVLIASTKSSRRTNPIDWTDTLAASKIRFSYVGFPADSIDCLSLLCENEVTAARAIRAMSAFKCTSDGLVEMAGKGVKKSQLKAMFAKVISTITEEMDACISSFKTFETAPEQLGLRESSILAIQTCADVKKTAQSPSINQLRAGLLNLRINANADPLVQQTDDLDLRLRDGLRASMEQWASSLKSRAYASLKHCVSTSLAEAISLSGIVTSLLSLALKGQEFYGAAELCSFRALTILEHLMDYLVKCTRDNDTAASWDSVSFRIDEYRKLRPKMMPYGEDPDKRISSIKSCRSALSGTLEAMFTFQAYLNQRRSI